MPHTTSAKKALRQTAKRNLRNRAEKKAIKIQIKKFLAVVKEGTPDQKMAEFKAAVRKIDKAATKKGHPPQSRIAQEVATGEETRGDTEGGCSRGTDGVMIPVWRATINDTRPLLYGKGLVIWIRHVAAGTTTSFFTSPYLAHQWPPLFDSPAPKRASPRTLPSPCRRPKHLVDTRSAARRRCRAR